MKKVSTENFSSFFKMNFLLTASILLLVPLAFADVTSQTEIKIIYDNTTVLTEQKEGTYMSYYNRVFDSAVNIYFGLGYNLTIADRRFDNVKEAGYRFVVEKVRLPSGSEFDCLENTSASLRPLISCQGSVRARELTNVEQKQIEEFKNNREELAKKFKVVSRGGQLTTKSHDRMGLTVIDTQDELYVEDLHPHPNPSLSKAILHGHKGNSFVVEGNTDNSNCYPSPVKGLEVASCKGKILVRDLTESD